MGDLKTAATGAVMRIDTLQRYAAEAGFGSVEVLPIDTPEWRFYRLHPWASPDELSWRNPAQHLVRRSVAG